MMDSRMADIQSRVSPEFFKALYGKSEGLAPLIGAQEDFVLRVGEEIKMPPEHFLRCDFADNEVRVLSVGPALSQLRALRRSSLVIRENPVLPPIEPDLLMTMDEWPEIERRMSYPGEWMRKPGAPGKMYVSPQTVAQRRKANKRAAKSRRRNRK